MIELYTRDQWHSIFSQPSIIIEDNGNIYNREDYYKMIRQPIGEVDTSNGLIYGTDYASISRQPVGKMVRDGDVVKVYGDDYYKSFAQPLYFFRDGYIYAGNDFYRGKPSGYYKGDLFTGASGSVAASQPVKASAKPAESPEIAYDPNDPVEKFFSFLELAGNALKFLVIVGVILYLAFFLTVEAYFRYSEYYDYFLVELFAALIGAVVVFFVAKKDNNTYTIGAFVAECIEKVYATCFLIFGIYVLARAVLDAGLRWWVIFLPILSAFISFLLSIVPAIIVGPIAGVSLYFWLPKEKRIRGSKKKKKK